MARWAGPLVAVLALSACDSGSGPVREWVPSDHDPPLANQAPQVAGRSSGQASDDASLVELAWSRNCARCHGVRGRGDGPEGAMVRAPDLTRPEWLTKVTDEQLLEVIKKGKNKMPGFDGALPAPVLDGLVRRIRAAR